MTNKYEILVPFFDFLDNIRDFQNLKPVDENTNSQVRITNGGGGGYYFVTHDLGLRDHELGQKKSVKREFLVPCET